MASDAQTQSETGLGSVVTSGIQDISAFLPILGTDQCETHCCLGMDRGFWYVAAAPLSIFGSLGIIKAGLVTLIISIDVPGFRGPRLLQNAGFSPPGILKQLTYILDDDDSIYVAEQNIRSMLRQNRVTTVVPNLYSRPWLRWNLRMFFWTMILSGLGIIPYVYILIRDIAHRPFSSTWMYPLLRVLGSALAAAMIQLIIQFRLMTIVHRRLTFHVVNHLFKEERREPPTWWNPVLRSEDCLSKLSDDISGFKQNRQGYLREDGGQGDRDKLDKRFVGVGPFKPYPRDNSTTRNERTFQPIVICTVASQIALFLAMGVSGWGYIGCFNIVQSSNNAIGPLVWLALEVVLSIIRLGIWAVNPTTDDPPPPIVISQDGVAHDIGWKLEDVTVDMHAVVIDIPQPSSEVQASVARWPMFEYLTKDLAVPEDQVQHIRSSNPKPIWDALRSLAKNPAIPRGSPIVIYISHCSGENTDSEWIGNNEQGLEYSVFFDLVRRISGTKGENVAVILDTNYPKLGKEAKHDSEPHVLLTACSAGEHPQEGNRDSSGGFFTEELLDALKLAGVEKLSYEKVIKKVTGNMEFTGKTPKCMGIFKERLIFNGVLARKRPRKAEKADSTSSLISATFARPTGDTTSSRSTTYTTANIDKANGTVNGTS